MAVVVDQIKIIVVVAGQLQLPAAVVDRLKVIVVLGKQ